MLLIQKHQSSIMNSEYICEMQNVSKVINNVHILTNVDMQIRKGRVTALLGPNGAGKTTTIRIILSLLKPTYGDVFVFGEHYSRHSGSIRGRVGLLPQKNAGYRQLTALENLKFILKLNGLKYTEIEPDLEELLKRLDLKEVMDKKMGKLSGGESRALGFIRAVLTGKEFLILDEPTTGLDLARAVQLRRIIQEQVDSGKTVLMSSHVITDLEELAQDIIILKKGRVIKSGNRQQIQQFFAPNGKLEDAIVNAFMEE